MEVIRSFFKHDLRLNSYLSGQACFFDIETTGFSREKNIIYMVGILYLKDGLWTLDQYFLNNLDQEAHLIQSALDFLNSFDRIISYNGDSFDLGFLRARASKYKLDASLDPSKSLDLYRIVRKHKDLLGLADLKLKTLERSLGIFRQDIYSGGQCIDLYKDYIVSKNPEPKKLVLGHNKDDLYHMLDLIQILDIIRDKSSFYLEIASRELSFSLEDFSLKKDSLVLNYKIKPALDWDLRIFEANHSIYSETKDQLGLRLLVKRAYTPDAGLLAFLDLRDYQLDLEAPLSPPGLDLPSYIYGLSLDNKLLLANVLSLSQALVKNSLAKL